VATGNEYDDGVDQPSSAGWVAGSPSSDSGEMPGRVPPPYPGAHAAPAEGSSLRARVTLTLAVIGSILLIGATLLFWRQAGSPDSGPPAIALPEPWEPLTVPPSSAAAGPILGDPPVSGSVPLPTAGDPQPGGGGVPPQTTAPTKTTPPAPTNRPTTSQPRGPNLSLNADSDGSSKATDTSFGDVQDGNLSTFWSPKGTTGEISIKWTAAVTLARINIREASGGGTIGSWRVTNYDTGATLAAGTGAGVITFAPTTLRKITFGILSASGVPRVAEFETFAH
jgi:hypothetical protein